MFGIWEEAHCADIRLLKWNVSVPNNGSNANSGIFLFFVNNKFVSPSTTTPTASPAQAAATHTSYPVFPWLVEFDTARLLSSQSVDELARDAVERTEQFLPLTNTNLGRQISDYLRRNVYFSRQDVLAGPGKPKLVIVVNVCRTRVWDFLAHRTVEGVELYNVVREHDDERIVATLRRLLDVPALSVLKRAAVDQREEIVRVTGLDMFEKCGGLVEGTCSICLEDLSSASTGRTHTRKTPCSHLFHGRCLARWLWRNSSCPMCRSQLA